MKAAWQNPSLFAGWPSHVNMLFADIYYVIGKIIATSLVQGGEPPLSFSAAVADFIVYDKVCSKPCVDDILVSDVHEAIRNPHAWVCLITACNVHMHGYLQMSHITLNRPFFRLRVICAVVTPIQEVGGTQQFRQ